MFGDLNEKQEAYLKHIYASGTHVLSLINDILDLSCEPTKSFSERRLMDRRAFMAIVGGSILAPSLGADAQQPSKVHQIGYLNYGAPAESANRVSALRAGLREHGYVEGKDINIEFRWAETVERLRALADDLVRLKVDLIFAPSSTEVGVARQATSTIPIVFANHADPVGVGHVTSLARPGGNVTGLSVVTTEIVTKQLEMLKEVLPDAKRIGVLAVSTAPSTPPALHAIQAAAQRLGVQLVTAQVRTVEDLDKAFSMMVRERTNGYVALASPLLRSQRVVIAELSLKHRLAGFFAPKEHVEAGGFMSYGADQEDTARRGATYIDKILRGARPADLPVEQASKYELVINMKTAKALRLTIRQTLLLRADQIIE
jgi:putative ABC transport system substrate-binding protein